MMSSFRKGCGEMGVFSSILSAIFEIYMADMFFSYFGNRRLSSKAHGVLIAVATAVLSVCTYFFIPTNHSMYTYTAILVLFSFLFKLKPIMRLFAIVAECFIAMFAETVATFLIIMFTDINLNLMRDINSMHWLIGVLLSKFLTFGIIKLVGVRKINAEGLSSSFVLGLFTMPLASIFIIFLMFNTSTYINDDYYLLLVIMSGILLTLANIFVFYIIEKQSDYIKTKEQLEFAQAHIEKQISHYKELYEQQETLKKFRHDSKNMYAALLSKIETLSPKEAAEYVREQLNIVNSPNGEINSGNPVIDAVIHSKLDTAKNSNIQIQPTFRLTKNIQINELELGVLIGNAIDNAIEATVKISDETQRIITVSLVSVEEMLSVKVTNPCPPPKKGNIWDSGGTSKEDSRNHGYGIRSMKTIAEKYGGMVTPEYKDGVFTLSAIMCNKII